MSHVVVFAMGYLAGSGLSSNQLGKLPPQGAQPAKSVRPISRDTGNQGASERVPSIVDPNLGYSRTSIEVSGRVTSAAAEAFGFTDEERKEVDRAVAISFAKLRNLVAERAVFDEVRSSSEEGLEVYSIPALPDRGEGLFNELKDDLIKILGPSRGREFCQSFDRGGAFSGFGSLDTTVKFHVPPSPEAPEDMVEMIARNPDNGNPVASWVAPFEDFQERYGQVFTRLEGD